MPIGTAIARGRARSPIFEYRSSLPALPAEDGASEGQKSSRANLSEMRNEFERTMDTRLIMEYVKVISRDVRLHDLEE